MKKVLFLLFLIFISLSKSESYINVSIAEKDDLVIRLSFKPVIYIGLLQIGNQTFLNLTDIQVIHSEIINIGSTNLTIKNFLLEILFFEGGRFVQLANYTDYFLPSNLLPGQKHYFNASYAPDRLGVHYIRATIEYNNRRAIAFGIFSVLLPPIIVPVQQPPITREVLIPKIIHLKPPVLQIIAPNTIDMFKGGNESIVIIVKNVGEREAFSLRPYVSIPKQFDFSIAPLYVAILKPNESVPFLLALHVDKNALEGVYPVSFEIVANETSASKTIYVNVRELPKIIDFCEDARNKILSFEFMLVLIRSRIYSFYLKGADVKSVNDTVIIIESNITKAKILVDENKCLEALQVLEEVRVLIERVLIELETILLIPKYVPGYFFIIAICLIVFVPIFVFILVKRRKRRPKLLKHLKVE
ncbi:MAG: hypothetical protein QXG91_03035 [Candidatus Aenigmatarchaeota archaeon]